MGTLAACCCGGGGGHGNCIRNSTQPGSCGMVFPSTVTVSGSGILCLGISSPQVLIQGGAPGSASDICQWGKTVTTAFGNVTLNLQVFCAASSTNPPCDIHLALQATGNCGWGIHLNCNDIDVNEV